MALQVPPSWSHGDLCFSFSHWLTGHHVGVLQLFIKKKGRDERSQICFLHSDTCWSHLKH